MSSIANANAVPVRRPNPVDMNLTVQPQVIDDVLAAMSTTQAPKAAGVNPFAGNIIVSDRWLNTDLVTELRKTSTVTFTDDSGVVDFFPSSDSAVVYLTNDDLGATIAVAKRKLVKLRNKKNFTGIVIAERRNSNVGQFNAVQKFAVVDLGLKTVFPVANQQEAALVLSQMVFIHNGVRHNPFKEKKVLLFTTNDALGAIQCIPGIGEIKAKRLLERFGSFRKICDASIDDLSSVVTNVQAVDVYKFFHERTKSN